ncbi:MAG: Response regulator protein VraR [Haliscomenobacter sp.]|jgi:DNA-binding NarL/FixJ family response regulator|nr:Response regulator protein VraR [Haliscomenobacter sp.]
MLIRVAVYEDNSALREALEILIKGISTFQLVGSYGDCLHIEQNLKEQEPDVVLMDIDLPGRSGIEGAYLIKRDAPSVEVLMLTVFDEDDKVFQAVCAGASGYLLKKSPPSKILEAIEEVYNGGAPMSPVIARKVLQLFPKAPAINNELDKLTQRERDVLVSLSRGNSYKMVAAELEISTETVRTYVKRIYEKLHVHSVTEAIAKAFLK